MLLPFVISLLRFIIFVSIHHQYFVVFHHSSDHRSSTVLDYVVITDEHLGTVHDMLVDEQGIFGGGSDHNMLLTSMSDQFISTRRMAPRPPSGWNFEEETNFTMFRQVVAREVDLIRNVGPGVDGYAEGATVGCLPAEH